MLSENTRVCRKPVRLSKYDADSETSGEIALPQSQRTSLLSPALTSVALLSLVSLGQQELTRAGQDSPSGRHSSSISWLSCQTAWCMFKGTVSEAGQHSEWCGFLMPNPLACEYLGMIFLHILYQRTREVVSPCSPRGLLGPAKLSSPSPNRHPPASQRAAQGSQTCLYSSYPCNDLFLCLPRVLSLPRLWPNTCSSSFSSQGQSVTEPTLLFAQLVSQKHWLNHMEGTNHICPSCLSTQWGPVLSLLLVSFWDVFIHYSFLSHWFLIPNSLSLHSNHFQSLSALHCSFISRYLAGILCSVIKTSLSPQITCLIHLDCICTGRVLPPCEHQHCTLMFQFNFNMENCLNKQIKSHSHM